MARLLIGLFFPRAKPNAVFRKCLRFEIEKRKRLTTMSQNRISFSVVAQRILFSCLLTVAFGTSNTGEVFGCVWNCRHWCCCGANTYSPLTCSTTQNKPTKPSNSLPAQPSKSLPPDPDDFEHQRRPGNDPPDPNTGRDPSGTPR